MRLWHYKLLPYLPDAQFKGQLREFGGGSFTERPFKGWHNERYLRCCMANLYEKHVFGIGRSRITEAEWEKAAAGYYDITGKHYEI